MTHDERCTIVMGCARDEFEQISVICFRTPCALHQHSTEAQPQSIVPVGWLLGVFWSLVFPWLFSRLPV